MACLAGVAHCGRLYRATSQLKMVGYSCRKFPDFTCLVYRGYEHSHHRFLPRTLMSTNTVKKEQQNSADKPDIAKVQEQLYKARKYKPNRGPDFTEIYRFHHINTTRILTAAKIWQTILVVLGSPLMLMLHSQGIVSKLECQGIIGLAGFACFMLYVMTGFLRRIACVIYSSKKSETIDISHMTFWGRRMDTRVDLSNIKALSDTEESLKSTFVRLETYSPNKTFFFFPRFGKVSDRDHLKRVLGIKD